MNNTSEYSEIRSSVDGSDVFMAGHSVRRGGKGAVAAAERRANVPKWTRTDKEIQTVIRRAFPHFETNERQRKFAGRWARVIYLYFRAGHTYSQIAEEMNLKSQSTTRPYAIVERMIAHIHQVAKGLSSHSERGVRKPRGRPRKIGV